MTIKSKIAKSDILFDRELSMISGTRIAKGLDKKWAGRPMIERKILRHPKWRDIKRDLEIAKFFPEDNNGFIVVFNWFNVMIISFVAVLFFGGLIYAMGLLNDVLMQVGTNNEVNAGMPGYTNMTYAAQVTFGKANEATQGLRLVAMTLIFSLIIATFLVNFLVKIHPAYFFVYVLIVLLAVLFSAPISNAYFTILQSGIYGGILPSFMGSGWILLHLPYVITFGGILGGVLLFINIIRGSDQGDIR